MDKLGGDEMSVNSWFWYCNVQMLTILPTRLDNSGKSSVANQGFFFCQMLLRGDGWGSGKYFGKYRSNCLTVSVKLLCLFSLR